MTDATRSTLPELGDFQAFWAFYLGEHLSPASRGLHYAGLGVGLVLLARFVVFSSLTCGLCAIPGAYALAWTGHVLLEGNRPATWRHPLWSLRAEFRMVALAATGRLRGEFARLELPFGRA